MPLVREDGFGNTHLATVSFWIFTFFLSSYTLDARICSRFVVVTFDLTRSLYWLHFIPCESLYPTDVSFISLKISIAKFHHFTFTYPIAFIHHSGNADLTQTFPSLYLYDSILVLDVNWFKFESVYLQDLLVFLSLQWTDYDLIYYTDWLTVPIDM